MFKISDNLLSSFSNYTNFKCTYFFAKETMFAIVATYLWPLTVDIMQKFSCMVVNQIKVYSYGFLFNCTMVGQASDSMMALT